MYINTLFIQYIWHDYITPQEKQSAFSIQITISQNTKCADMISFCKPGHN